jgi:tRNA1Val (adenine37-N6)-methyltransferase
MPNDWFQFKQFLIRQDQTAMKTGTDSVILGCWAEHSRPQRILDVGTGSGILALMMAQRFECEIDALEIDQAAFQQATRNIQDSPWSNRIYLYPTRFQDYKKDKNHRYDLIICNPPYFSDSLKSGEKSRDLARHNDSLRPVELLKGASTLLNECGSLAIILPAMDERFYLQTGLLSGLYANRILEVHPKQGKPAKRVAIQFSGKKIQTFRTHLVVEDVDGYSAEYKNLTSDFYLNH